ncbi:hypothetical protein VTN77DRAFT_9441 [Rasamsonia byssochlamydoides]|uniref:uncharacterized protein n=1 Tax=Rasamsonia byssochlamydoides TaxID=89139 RepID=UPI003742C9B5
MPEGNNSHRGAPRGLGFGSGANKVRYETAKQQNSDRFAIVLSPLSEIARRSPPHQTHPYGTTGSSICALLHNDTTLTRVSLQWLQSPPLLPAQPFWEFVRIPDFPSPIPLPRVFDHGTAPAGWMS